MTKGDFVVLVKEMREGFKRIDQRFDGLEAYMKQGFETLNDKIDFVDESLSFKIDGLSNRIDDLSTDKASRREYRELDKRVSTLELALITKPKHKK